MRDIINARIPTEKAHGYQIAKMCQAFARQGANISLWAPKRANEISDSVFSYYNLPEGSFSVRFINSIDLIDMGLKGRFGYTLQTAYFLFKLFFTKVPKETVIYTRQPEIVWLFSLRGFKVIYEDHAWPQHKGLYFWCTKKHIKLWQLHKVSNKNTLHEV